MPGPSRHPATVFSAPWAHARSAARAPRFPEPRPRDPPSPPTTVPGVDRRSLAGEELGTKIRIGKYCQVRPRRRSHRRKPVPSRPAVVDPGFRRDERESGHAPSVPDPGSGPAAMSKSGWEEGRRAPASILERYAETRRPFWRSFRPLGTRPVSRPGARSPDRTSGPAALFRQSDPVIRRACPSEAAMGL